MSQIKCENLTIGYDGKAILKNISFSIEKGDYLCIVGENGSGKSTLMKTLLGLLNPIDGKIITEDGFKQTDIGFLPQQTEIQRDFPASVKEIVLSGRQAKNTFRPFYNKKDKQSATEAMEKMHIENLSKKSYRELSGGQQQRVLLARALCATKQMLLLDEPVTGLDPNVTAEMYELIEKLNKQEKITVIMISHDIATAVQKADRILHIGKKIFFGTTSQYLESDIGQAFVKNSGGENND